MIVKRLLSVISPPECFGCGLEGRLICSDCRAKLVIKAPTCWRCNRLTPIGQTCPSCRHAAPLSGVTVAAYYDGPVKDLIQALKYGHLADGAVEAASLLTPLLEPKFDLVTAVPTAPSRRRQRGYNQAELIARQVASQLALPYLPTLARLAPESQVGHTKRERLEQIKAAFYAPKLLPGQAILIIDDVLTTGATLAECSRVLKAAGAKRIWGAVVAKH